MKNHARRTPWPVERLLVLAWCIVRLEWPYSVAHAKALLVTRRPDSYSQKVRYKIARDRRPILTTWADKIAIRDYVAEKVGAEQLLDVYSRADSASNLNLDSLPREFVLKVNHGCGGMIIVSNAADPDVRLPVPSPRTRWSRHMIHPDATDRSAIVALLDSWLNLRYGWGLGSHWEWAYRDIIPMVYAEEFVGAGGPAQNLKVHCVHGEPLLGTVTRLGGDLAGDVVDARFFVPDAPAVAKALGLRLDEWHHIEAMCRSLSSETDFVRLDWLLTARGPKFGEFTNYPAAGHGAVMPVDGVSGPEVAAWLSAQWLVPDRYV